MTEVDFESVVDEVIAQVVDVASCPDQAQEMCVRLSAEHAMSRNQLARLIGEVECATAWNLSIPTFH